MHLTQKAGLALALLSGASLNALPAHAQTATLTLGQLNSSTLSGIATLTNAGATAVGNYAYDDAGTGKFLDSQNNYSTLFAYGSSTANVQGGNIYDLATHGSSTANVGGGFIGLLETFGPSIAYVSGGSITDLNTYAFSTANVSAGNIEAISSLSNSTANVSGGSINGLFTYGNSKASVSGGTIGYLSTNGNSTVSVSGGNIRGINTYDNSVLDLFGSGFQIAYREDNGVFYAYGIGGTLQDGELLNADYSNYGGTLELNVLPAAVPESSPVVSLGLLLTLGLGGMVIAAKRKKRPA